MMKMIILPPTFEGGAPWSTELGHAYSYAGLIFPQADCTCARRMTGCYEERAQSSNSIASMQGVEVSGRILSIMMCPEVL